jgi:hypothetical protein
LGRGDKLTVTFDIDTNQQSVKTLHTVQKVELLSEGTFQLLVNYGNVVANTSKFNSSTTSEDLKAGLQKLPNVGSVHVSRGGGITGLTSLWIITFVGNTGNVPLLAWKPAPDAIEEASLRVSSVTVGSKTPSIQSITTRSDHGWYIYGVFKVEHYGQQTGLIRHDASAEALKAELEALSTIGMVSVSRTEADYKGSVTWTITFLATVEGAGAGDGHASSKILNISQVSFPAPYTGEGHQVKVEQIQQASGRRSVYELLVFSSPIGDSLNATWVSARALEVTVLKPNSNASLLLPVPSVNNISEIGVGYLTVSVNPASGLKRADGSKPATNTSVVVKGTWG